jgi:hypothetical protein
MYYYALARSKADPTAQKLSIATLKYSTWQLAQVTGSLKYCTLDTNVNDACQKQSTKPLVRWLIWYDPQVAPYLHSAQGDHDPTHEAGA